MNTQNRVVRTMKQVRAQAKKDAKEKYKLSKKHGSNEYNRLKAYTIDVLTRVHETTFNCGSLNISLLKD